MSGVIWFETVKVILKEKKSLDEKALFGQKGPKISKKRVYIIGWKLAFDHPDNNLEDYIVIVIF